MKSAFLIAAPTSGSGKTTIARGLMALFSQKGYSVQPFKCGPDYIDTKFHEAVCGRPSVNLDTFMATPDHVRHLFAHYGQPADICIAEGMMGLFDGYDRDRGSSAEIARTLHLPVILVVDAKSAAYSMAPLLKGFTTFRHDIHIAGIIYNKVGSARHYEMLKQVCDDLHLRCLGYLPKQQSLETGSRYLGLDFSAQSESEELVHLLETHVDWEYLTTLTPAIDSLQDIPTPCDARRVLIARNKESFSFLYTETIDRFAHPRFFDPEEDAPIPDDIDLLYLPGGYPEKHLEALVRARRTRQSIKDFAERGGHILAECGGMMYLCQEIITDEGTFPMCGVLPYSITARQQDRKLSLGYRRFMLDGQEYRGHEFHYTTFVGTTPPSICQAFNAKGQPVSTPVFRYHNVLASYTHLYPTHTPSTTHQSSPRLSPVMLAGTGSDVGKSVLATALCRIFLQDGYHPAPFKAQNMALNSYATPDGLEIGRAQAVQAEAAGTPCHTDMNPLLLKPQSDHTSQVVLHGRPIGQRDAYDFWRNQQDAKQQKPVDKSSKSTPAAPDFRQEVCDAFDRLSSRYAPIVMEGAGSISEINLRNTDLVNLPMARHARAKVILVGDIDRGGVFASVYGSIALQSEADRRLIKGIIINKFRGDLRLFDQGRQMLEDLCGIPVLGVIPYAHDIHIEEEDSVALAQKSLQALQGKVNVAVILLRHLSNYTDFNVLEQDPRLHLFYTNNVDDILQADIIILPGTKSTINDLYELRRNGVAQAIIQAHRRGASILGICGGYQMMGIEINDPNHVEGDMERLPGLGLLPVTTTMSGQKITRQVQFHSPLSCQGQGYEIHMGDTHPFGDATASPFAFLDDGRTDGYVVSNRCLGTYIHGVLDNPSVVDMLLSPLADKIKNGSKPFDYQAFKEEQYNKLADHVRRHLDMERLYQIMRSDD